MQGRPTEPIEPAKVLREVLRHYTEFRTHVGNTGDHVIEHSYFIYKPDLKTPRGKVTIGFSFWDLHRGIKQLSPRKREALFYNVILDWKQKDVAEKMGITTVSVGQYCMSSVHQLIAAHEENGIAMSVDYFDEEND